MGRWGERDGDGAMGRKGDNLKVISLSCPEIGLQKK